MPDGWEIEIEVHANRAAIHELEDVLNASEKARVPKDLSFIITDRFVGSPSKSYLYRALTRTSFEDTSSRGEKNTVRMTVKTGEDRVAG